MKLLRVNLEMASSKISASVLLLLVLSLLFSPKQLVANTIPFGPGIAGQIHSLAYDPDDENIVYSGGDMHGVFMSMDHGQSWVVINEGLQNTDCNESFYIEDLFVLGDFHDVLDSRKGVYAATAGGVYFRGVVSNEWVLLTDYHLNPELYSYYEGAAVGSQGGGLPFSSFAFDKEAKVLYAGTGSARLLKNSCNIGHNDFYQVYPQHDSGNPGYSIWSLNVNSETHQWEPDIDSLGLMMVKQVTVVERTGGVPSDIVFASCSGIYKKDQNTGHWEEIFNQGNKSFPVIGKSWSDLPTGVSGGSADHLYCICEGIYNDQNTDLIEVNGVFQIDLSQTGAPWVVVGGESLAVADIVPHSNLTWLDVISNENTLLGTLTVVPGDTFASDEIFVGVRKTPWYASVGGNSSIDGYFRYGNYFSDGIELTGWSHILYRETFEIDQTTFNSLNYHATPDYQTASIDPGWLVNAGIYSTVPMVVHPANPDNMFAINYHLPMASENGGRTWTQENCTGSGSSWTSNGNNQMHVFDVEFASDGRMWLGSRDYGLFEETQPFGNSFEWVDRSRSGRKRVMALQEVEDDVFALRMGPKREWNNTPDEFFGYASGLDEVTYAQTVVAEFDPAIAGIMAPNGLDGFGWRYHTRGLDSVYPGVKYRVCGFEMVGNDTLFVGCVQDGMFHTTILRRIFSEEGELWTSWPPIYGFHSGEGRMILKKIPNTNKLLVGADDGNQSGIYCLNTNDSYESPSAWLNSSLTLGDPILGNLSLRISSLDMDDVGQFLYVGTYGNFEVSGAVEIGSVLRLENPATGFTVETPDISDWHPLANFDGHDFFFEGIERPYFWYSEYSGDGATEAGQRLTHIADLSVDPVNPRIVYAGLGGPYVGYLHPRSGVWKFDLDEHWTQLTGFSEGEPFKGCTTVEINPADTSILIMGTAGAELFKVDITPSVSPQISTVAEYQLLTGGDAATVFAVQVTHPEGLELDSVVLDATSIGNVGNIVLLDDGEGFDQVGGDNVFTSGELSLNWPSGQAEVSVLAQASDFGYVREIVQVELVDAPVFKFVDGSGATGDLLNLTGQPYSVVTFSPELDQERDFMVLSKDDQTLTPELFEVQSPVGGVPNFADFSEDVFTNALPSPGSRGLHYADFDNDGDQDLFVCNNGSNTTLYTFDEGAYTNVTSPVFDPADILLLEGAHVAAWGDYNQDGWLDLFVGTMDYQGPVHDFTQSSVLSDPSKTRFLLFKGDGTYLKLANPGVLAVTGSSPTLSASWNDVDQDGLIDLVITRLINNMNSVQVYFNNGYRRSFDEFWLRLRDDADEVTGLLAQSLNWIDYNHDQFPDLVVTQLKGFSGARILVNTGNGFSALSSDLGSSRYWNGAAVGDFDNNGNSDVVLLPYSGIPEFLLEDDSSSTGYSELGSALGLRPGGTSSGALAANLNDDKDLDLYLGRSSTESFMYVSAGPDGEIGQGTTTNNNWVGFKLQCENPYTGDFTTVPGAQVKVVAGSSDYYQSVDGGSARGGQQPTTLHFGLGNYSETVDVYVNWPNGVQSVHLNLSVNQMNTLSEETIPEVVAGSELFLFEPYPGGADGVFKWITPVRGYEDHDAVHVVFDSSNGCFDDHPGDILLEKGEDGVEIEIYPIVGGGWRHKLTWHNLGCYANTICTFTYQVQSKPGDDTWGDEITFSGLNVCIKTKPVLTQ